MNEIVPVLGGMFLLVFCHAIAIGLVLVLVALSDSLGGGYTGISIMVIGLVGFMFWQLLYVLPLVIWLRRKGANDTAKGVMIGAVLTALVNGTCFLSIFR